MLHEAAAREVRDLVTRLDQLIPRDGALLVMPADPDGNTTVGNQLGYLRIGVEFIAAALEPQPKTPHAPPRILPELSYLLREGAETPFDLCEIDEAVADRPPIKTPLGAFGQLAAAVMAVTVIVFLFIGAIVAWRWIFS